MKYRDTLDDEARAQLEEIGKTDILVGIPSYNNERTIAHVVRAVQYGLIKYFPKQRALIINSDGGSTERTREIVKEASEYTDLDNHPIGASGSAREDSRDTVPRNSGEGKCFQDHISDGSGTGRTGVYCGRL